jgi:hypothetical protein
MFLYFASSCAFPSLWICLSSYVIWRNFSYGVATENSYWVPDGGGSKHLWNVGQVSTSYTAQHSRRQLSSDLPLGHSAIT